MIRRYFVSMAMFLLVALCPRQSLADVLKVAPTASSLLPDGSAGESRVILVFDLSSMRAGENRVVRGAVLDWDLPGVPDSEDSAFEVYGVGSAWTPSSIALGTTPTISVDPESEWVIGPEDYSRTGGFTRLDLTALVSDWASGEKGNYGVVVSTSALSAESLLSQASNARLVVLYTFRK